MNTSPKTITDEVQTVKLIVERYLTESGFDGLWSEDECACKLDDIMACNADNSSCRPGFLQPHNGDQDTEFSIGLFKGDI